MSTSALRPPRLVPPRSACDCHMHVYDDRFPVSPAALFAPAPAPLAAYRRLAVRLGLERAVVVQPSAYGTDNRCTIEAVAALGADGRGVVAVEAGIGDTELARMATAGIRGVRFFLLRDRTVPRAALERMAARVAPLGWHLQLSLDGSLLPDLEAVLLALPGTLVIDHIGRFPEPVPPDHPAFRALRRLVDAGRTWVKLSAPYEASRSGPPLYEDVGRLAVALVAAAPQRMLWASNWPHPSARDDDKPDDVELLELLGEWAPDEAVQRRILVDNPAVLYGF